METVKLETIRGIHGITSEELHYWWNIAGTQFLVSNEHSKGKHTLWSFGSVDDAINYLFINGFKQSASDINEHKED